MPPCLVPVLPLLFIQHPISACCCRRLARWCQMAAHTDVHSSLQLCQVLFSIGVRWPLWAETPLSPSPLSTSSPCLCLALIWVSLASLVIVLLVWLINGDGACLDRTEERMNFKSPPARPPIHINPSSTHTHTYTYEFNELFTDRSRFVWETGKVYFAWPFLTHSKSLINWL